MEPAVRLALAAALVLPEALVRITAYAPTAARGPAHPHGVALALEVPGTGGRMEMS